MPVTVSVAPGSTAPVESTLVTMSVPAGAGACRSADLSAVALAKEEAPGANVDACVGDAGAPRPNKSTHVTITERIGSSLRGRVETARINLGVDPIAIERGFFGR